MQKMKLHAIIIGADAKEALHYVTTAEAVAGRGLKDDRYYWRRGYV